MSRNKRGLDPFQRRYLNDGQGVNLTGKINRKMIFDYYYQRLLEDYLSIFEWQGLPEHIPQYAIEYGLLRYGKLCMFENIQFIKDDVSNEIIDMSKLDMATFVIERWDSYMQPVVISTRPIFNPSMDINFHRQMDSYDFEYCYNTASGMSPYQFVMFFVNMLTEIEVSIKMTCVELRIPYLFEGTQEAAKTYDQLMKKIRQGDKEYFVFNKDFLTDGKLVKHDLLNGDPSKRLDSLYMAKEKYMQEFYTMIGAHTNINNKNERLTENESIGFNEIGNLNINGMLTQRQSFVERANKRFNLNMSVGFSSAIREKIKDVEESENIIESEVETSDND